MQESTGAPWAQCDTIWLLRVVLAQPLICILHPLTFATGTEHEEADIWGQPVQGSTWTCRAGSDLLRCHKANHWSLPVPDAESLTIWCFAAPLQSTQPYPTAALSTHPFLFSFCYFPQLFFLGFYCCSPAMAACPSLAGFLLMLSTLHFLASSFTPKRHH